MSLRRCELALWLIVGLSISRAQNPGKREQKISSQQSEKLNVRYGLGEPDKAGRQGCWAGAGMVIEGTEWASQRAKLRFPSVRCSPQVLLDLVLCLVPASQVPPGSPAWLGWPWLPWCCSVGRWRAFSGALPDWHPHACKAGRGGCRGLPHTVRRWESRSPDFPCWGREASRAETEPKVVNNQTTLATVVIGVLGRGAPGTSNGRLLEGGPGARRPNHDPSLVNHALILHFAGCEAPADESRNAAPPLQGDPVVSSRPSSVINSSIWRTRTGRSAPDPHQPLLYIAVKPTKQQQPGSRAHSCRCGMDMAWTTFKQTAQPRS